jgi:hypothetical protein
MFGEKKGMPETLMTLSLLKPKFRWIGERSLMPGIADDKDHLEGDEQHEEKGVRAASDKNQKTIRPNLNIK